MDIVDESVSEQDTPVVAPSFCLGNPASLTQHHSHGCVLVLDDDYYFQELIGGMLKAHGCEVFTARSAAEATAFFAARQPDLVIVDYHLPRVDGITWISQLRERGDNTPIIFVSGSWCDAKTFNWLRNILHVSLVFQKPIDPQLFMHAIDDVLPPDPDTMPQTSTNVDQPSSKQTDYAELLDKGNLDNSLKNLDELLASSGNNPVAVNELVQIRRKLRAQKAIQTAQEQFMSRLPVIWTDLIEKIIEGQKGENARATMLPALDGAHKLKGTAGSYGLSHLSDICGQLENFLRSVEPSCSPEELKVYWSEIAHLSERGSEIIDALRQVDGPLAESKSERPLSLLLVSPNDNYRAILSDSIADNIDVHLVSSAAGAVTKAKSIHLDAAVIDLSLDMTGLVPSLTRHLRGVRQCSQLPFLFIGNPSQYRNLSELVYSGCSALLEPPISEKSLNDAIQCLRDALSTRERRVLCVDDDELLTFFVSSILNQEGYEAKALNEPIHILDTLESFQPDLILLDVKMPGLSGYEVCRMLRSHKEWGDIPIIFLTAKNDPQSRAASFQAGGNDFLAKPILPEELMARVKAQLALSEQSRDSELELTTGVLHWEPFKKQAARSLQKCMNENVPASLGMIVIENYDQLDDKHGGHSKQQVLAELGYLLSIRFRINDVRGSWKEGTFAIAFPGEGSNTTFGALELLQEEFKQSFFTSIGGQQFQTGLKIGVANAGTDGLSFESLAKVAITRALNSNSAAKTRADSRDLWRLPVS